MRSRLGSLALVLLAAAAAAPALQAGVDVDLGVAVDINDRSSLFFSISSRYFERDPATVSAFGERFADPDDLAVALFIQRHCGRSLYEISDLRTKGTTWWDIALRCGVRPEAWFVPVRRQPGPPYGKAYGHWKKHKQEPSAMDISDADARNLVAVRFLYDYFGVSADIAMQWRAGERPVQDLVADEYLRRHADDALPASEVHSGADHRHSPGHGKKH